MSFSQLPAPRGVLGTFAGPANVSGNITVLGVSARRAVQLIAWPELVRVAVAVSDGTTGAYSFPLLAPRTYMLLALDDSGVYDAEAKIRTVT